MPSNNTSNKTVLYTYQAPDGTWVTLWNDGSETLSGSRPATTIGGNQSQTIYDTSDGKSTGSGTTANTIIYGNNAGDTIDGHKASGNDFYFGGNGKDILYAGTGNDYLDGNNGVDVLFGGVSNLTNSNTTMMVGGNGGDLLVDGAAKDIFLYRVTAESPYVAGGPVAVDTTSAATEIKTATNAWDVIVNFNSSKDKIDLSLLDQQLSNNGPTKLVWLGSQGTDAQAGQANPAHIHGVWTDAGGNFLYADTNGDGAADLKIQVHGVQSSNIVGIDNAPVVVGGAYTGSVTELANKTNDSTDTDSTGGTITFTDADSADTHHVTVHAEGTGYVGNFTIPSLSFVDSTGGITGSQGWSFGVTDSAIDFLGAGEHLTQKYDVTITDNYGAAITQVVTVTINGSIDAPTLSASAASSAIDEGGSVALNISTGDVDDNAHLTVTIGGVPSGAHLSAGTDNGGGSWTLATADLAGLTITPDSEFSGPIHLTVGVTNTEGLVTASVGPQSIDINVVPTADGPVLSAPTTLSVDEGGAVALNISAVAAEADQHAPSMVIGGLGDATLTNTAGDTLTITAGSITLTAAQLAGLTLHAGA
ncbi:MAG: large repetitive protein, partial [Bradyrhizobium sp.]|nr:large repetitive protein [Bradyrhizobium sp.]